MEWTNSISLLLIDLYRERECLWNPSHDDYKNKARRLEAWKEISETLDCNVPDLKKKMESLLTSFRRERQRELTDDVYKSTWFAFRRMLFLQDRFADKKTVNAEVEVVSEAHVDEEVSILEPITLLSSVTPEPPPIKKQKLSKEASLEHPMVKQGELLQAAVDYLSAGRRTEPDDEHLNVAKVWACKLKRLHPTQRKLAEKAINDVLFEADMGTLRRGSVQFSYAEHPSGDCSSSSWAAAAHHTDTDQKPFMTPSGM